MKNFFMVSFLVLIFTLGGGRYVSPVHAETERYDFPACRVELATSYPHPISPMPAITTVPQAVKNTASTDHDVIRKQNEAKRKSIAALLQRYNKKLSDEKAYEYAILIIQTSEKFRQNPFVIAAMVVNESSARPDVISRGGDYGLMQVRWRVHHKKIKKQYPHVTKANDILNPKVNLLVGTEIFSIYRDTANKDVREALIYYTGGNHAHADKVFATIAQLEKSYKERLDNI